MKNGPKKYLSGHITKKFNATKIAPEWIKINGYGLYAVIVNWYHLGLLSKYLPGESIIKVLKCCTSFSLSELCMRKLVDTQLSRTNPKLPPNVPNACHVVLSDCENHATTNIYLSASR